VKAARAFSVVYIFNIVFSVFVLDFFFLKMQLQKIFEEEIRLKKIFTSVGNRAYDIVFSMTSTITVLKPEHVRRISTR